MDRYLRKKENEEYIRAFLREAQAGLILNMFQITFGKFLMLNPLPENIKVIIER